MTALAQAINRDTSDAELLAISAAFENARPEIILRWALEEFGSGVAWLRALGPRVRFGQHAWFTQSRGANVLFGHRVFSRNIRSRSIETRYGVHFERIWYCDFACRAEARYGARLWNVVR